MRGQEDSVERNVGEVKRAREEDMWNRGNKERRDSADRKQHEKKEERRSRRNGKEVIAK